MSKVPEGIQSGLASFFGIQKQREAESAKAKRNIVKDGPLKKLNAASVSRHPGLGQVLALQDSDRNPIRSTKSDASPAPYRSALMKSLRLS